MTRGGGIGSEEGKKQGNKGRVDEGEKNLFFLVEKKKERKAVMVDRR